MKRLQPQLNDAVGVLTLTDQGQASIGAKRQRMLESATAEWVSFFDDDDIPAMDYVARVMSVIEEDNPPDVVGFRLRYFKEGRLAGFAVHSYEAASKTINGITIEHIRFDRLPNHLNPVRRKLALRAGFRNMTSGEDADYARRLAALVPRPREKFLDWYAYNYLDHAPRPGERVHS